MLVDAELLIIKYIWKGVMGQNKMENKYAQK